MLKKLSAYEMMELAKAMSRYMREVSNLSSISKGFKKLDKENLKGFE